MMVSLNVIFCYAQITFTVKDSLSGSIIAGATLKVIGRDFKALSDSRGSLVVPLLQSSEQIQVRHVNYQIKELLYGDLVSGMDILLVPKVEFIQEVEVSTGYYSLPKERATGSFEKIESDILDRAITPNFLERLEGAATGVQFVKSGTNKLSDIRVRGLGTIESDSSPLVIIDNFPYEGDLSNIDPNTIESVTILKDAAAGSIWGARAGNGVIVIRTKGAFSVSERVVIQGVFNTTIQNKPDFTYDRSWLPSAIVMDIEREKFEKNQYSFDNTTVVPMYVEYLQQHKQGKITTEELNRLESVLRATDTRQEARDYLYRVAENRQYGLYANGNSGVFNFRTGVAYNTDKGTVIGNENTRLNLSLQAGAKLFGDFTAQWSLAHVRQNGHNNGASIDDLSVAIIGGISPYIKLWDNGIALPVLQNGLSYDYTAQSKEKGLLDWYYRPIDERGLRNIRSESNELKFDVNVQGTIWKGVAVRVGYQFLSGNDLQTSHYFKESYYVRNLVNRFTQANGSYIIPYEGILVNDNPSNNKLHYGRMQLNYNTTFKSGTFNSLAGVDIRQSQSQMYPGSVLYNYSDEYEVGSNQFNFNQIYPNLPNGGARIPNANSRRGVYTNRDLSYYFNAGLELWNRVLLSNSLRWDGSNLFGVKSNQKGVPLWSTGMGWLLHNEDFFQESWFDQLKLRATYGISGNVNKSVFHQPIIKHAVNPLGVAVASVTSVGNPSLRWEKVKTINAGIDAKISKAGLEFILDFYTKKGSDLIGTDYMDPTTGVIGEYKINYADITTRGVDFRINGDWKLYKDLSLKSMLNLSLVSNRIENYSTNTGVGVSDYLQATAPPFEGRSKDILYALPTSGLNSSNGLPLIYRDGEVSDRYSSYATSIVSPDDLAVVGVSVPVRYASWMPRLKYKGISASIMFSYKGGYVFRRESMNPIGESMSKYHVDYLKRWAKPGDEQTTTVARRIDIDETDPEIRSASHVYTYGKDLITPGDHIRIQDINVQWQIPIPKSVDRYLKSMVLAGYLRNVGMVWKKNKEGIDPDFQSAKYRTPLSGAVSLSVHF